MSLWWGSGLREFERLHDLDTDECVEWPYSRTSWGYGQVWAEGRVVGTHRLSCEREHGPPPSDQKYDAAHSCHNPSCMNPRHLRWATRSENSRDKIADGTHNHGRNNPNAVLSEDDVRGMRQGRNEGLTQRVLAGRFGVSQATVSMVLSGKRWASVDPEHQTREVPSGPTAEAD